LALIVSQLSSSAVALGIMPGHHHHHRRCLSLKRTSEYAQYWLHERTSSLSRRHQSLKRDTSSTIDISQKVVLLLLLLLIDT